MRIIGPIIFSFTLMTIMALTNIAILKYLNKSWWKRKTFRRIAYYLPLAGYVALAIWLVSYYTKTIWLADIGAILTVVVVITLTGLIISLPFSGILNSINNYLTRRKEARTIKNDEIDLDSRRKFIAATAALFPIVALSAGASGITGGFQPIRVFRQPMSFANLPSELEGLRILHLSDSHLGIYRTLKDIEEIMQKAGEYKPDLTVITGDFADELKILPEALKIVASYKTRFGVYASLGNHEYYRGLPEVLRAYEKSDVVLLRSSGFSCNVRGEKLYVAGADDPVRMGIDVAPFLRKSIGKALDGAPSDAFYLLMSHRPESLDIAAESGINLTLAGHTHGGQVGLGGRSFWRFFNRDYYFWGEYAKNESQMYLSSGIGHWLPFRLGCPPEAPIIELTAKS